MKKSEVLFALIRNELFGEQLSADVISSLDDDCLNSLYSLSDFHDCAHLLYNPIVRSNAVDAENEILKKFRKKQMLALYQVSQIEHETDRVNMLFNKYKISHILLKGAVIRSFYPEPWMRTSCDVDILVHSEDIESASDALISELNYKKDRKPGYHDVSLFSENDIQLELHFSLKEDIEIIDRLLEKVWDYAVKKDDSFEYVLDNEYFMFHIISHMSYHFLSGGCGIRPFIDLWFLDNNLSFDKERLCKMLEKCSLVTFYENAGKLSEVWMNNSEHNKITKRMAKYVLMGGTYGTKENSISLRTSKKKSKFRYFLSRVFPSFSSLKIRYPILKKKPYLAPVYWFLRIFDSFFGKANEKTIYEIKTAMNIDEEKNSEILDLINTLGLK